jgi:hypothetical protein
VAEGIVRGKVVVVGVKDHFVVASNMDGYIVMGGIVGIVVDMLVGAGISVAIRSGC